MPRGGLFAEVPEDLRQGIKIAAIKEGVTVRVLMTRILRGWLMTHDQADRRIEER
jgi:hypothetical protein